MLTPLAGYLIVEAEKPQETSFGLILEQSKEKRPERGTVLSVGKGIEDVHKGDTIIFKKYAPDEIEITEGKEKKKYLVIRYDDVMAIVEEHGSN